MHRDNRLTLLPRQALVGLIRFYQKTLSPDHGLLKAAHPYGYCRYYPTCSEYGAQAITKYGVVKGGLLAIWRIIRCNPWVKGGADPLL